MKRFTCRHQLHSFLGFYRHIIAIAPLVPAPVVVGNIGQALPVQRKKDCGRGNPTVAIGNNPFVAAQIDAGFLSGPAGDDTQTTRVLISRPSTRGGSSLVMKQGGKGR